MSHPQAGARPRDSSRVRAGGMGGRVLHPPVQQALHTLAGGDGQPD